MWKLILVCCLLASAAWAQEPGTAYEALRVVGTQLNRASISRVISVTGVDGAPQPATWRVLIADNTAPGGVREIDVENGQIVANRTPRGNGSSSANATINTARLNLDSSGAYTVASYTAEKSHANFASVNYALRTNERGSPTWILTLQNERRQPVGTIHIAANKGNVTRVEGMYRGADMANVEQDRGADEEVSDEDIEMVDEDEEGENPVKREIKKMFRRTKRDARTMFERVGRSFDDFFRER